MKKKILVVDDEINILELIKLTLSDKYEIDTALNGIEALEKVKKKNYNLILLDIMMPQMDGFEVQRRLKAKKIKTPVIFLTAKGAWEDKMKALSQGGSEDYITKPFEIEDLINRTERALKKE